MGGSSTNLYRSRSRLPPGIWALALRPGNVTDIPAPSPGLFPRSSRSTVLYKESPFPVTKRSLSSAREITTYLVISIGLNVN